MTQPLRILVPTDDSPSAQRALRHVLTLAEHGLLVEVHLLNVQPSIRGMAASMVPRVDVEQYHREEAMKILDGFAQLVTDAGLTPHLHVGVGEPGENILHFASQLGCAQIVMGTHGFSNLGALVMGSVARHVVRETDLPVTLLRG